MQQKLAMELSGKADIDDESPEFLGTLGCLPFHRRNRFVNGCANGKQVKTTMPGGNLLKTPNIPIEIRTSFTSKM